MDAMIEAHVLPQLRQRRHQLEETVRRAPRAVELQRLLGEVDAAIARVDAGTYGLCATCHDPIETDRLLADPLVCVCIDHLSESEQRALERDLELASRIQRTLSAPRELSAAGWHLQLHVEPAGVVGGDWCDVFEPSPGSGLIFVLGDVSGKGLAAAMLMTHLHATFRSLAAEELPVSGLVERANQVFRSSTLSPYFATLVCGRLSADGTAEICNAGHWPPLVLGRRGVTQVPPTGLPVGTFASAHYSSQKVELGPGDHILLYTDGVTEARNAGELEYGTERIERLAAGRTWADPGALLAAVRSDLATHLDGVTPQDDLTLLAIGRD